MHYVNDDYNNITVNYYRLSDEVAPECGARSYTSSFCAMYQINLTTNIILQTY